MKNQERGEFTTELTDEALGCAAFLYIHGYITPTVYAAVKNAADHKAALSKSLFPKK